MIYSQFNSIIPYKGKYALYNTYTNKVIFIEKSLKKFLLYNKEDLDHLKLLHPTFYENLKDNDFLVSNDCSEVEIIKRASKDVDENRSNYLLTINPTMNCNFKCWYCYETHEKNSFMSEIVINNIYKFITKTTEKADLKHFSLSFFGGEPLIYFKKIVIPIIDYAKKETLRNGKLFSVSFTTNGYLMDDDFINYFRNNKIQCNLQITLDGFKDEHDQVRFVDKTKGSYDRIIENVKSLINNNLFVRLRINYTGENIVNTHKISNEFIGIGADIISKYLTIDYQRVWQDDKIDNIDIILAKNMKSFRDKGFNITGSFNPNSVLHSCYADKRNSVVINFNGDLYKCTARDFKSKNRVGYLNNEGDLIWNNDHLNKRMNSKFNNKPCLTCRLLPVCNGGCTQHALEHMADDRDHCIYSFIESQKDKVIKVKVDEVIRNVSEEK